MKIGDYVRTKKNGIGRIISFSYQEDDECCFIELSNRRTGVKQFNIIKSSPNIIDLIEVGDYVNGLKVSRVDGTYHGRKDKAIYCDYCENKETGKWTMIYADEIKSIVTKEQFESMEYKING